jgi:hypothetical protein
MVYIIYERGGPKQREPLEIVLMDKTGWFMGEVAKLFEEI